MSARDVQKPSRFAYAAVTLFVLLGAAKLGSWLTGAYALSWWWVFAPLIASWVRVLLVLTWGDYTGNRYDM